MKLLPVLYWVILILSIIGIFVPAPTGPNANPWLGRISGVSWVILFVIIGLQIFRMPL